MVLHLIHIIVIIIVIVVLYSIYERGYKFGKRDGYDSGHKNGFAIGYNEGFYSGKVSGFQMGIWEERRINDERIKKEMIEVHDLHGFTKKEAMEYVFKVLIQASYHGLQKIDFITGKGIHSENQEPVLRPYIIEICNQKRYFARINPNNSGMVEVYIY